jgi:hypothetical protein
MLLIVLCTTSRPRPTEAAIPRCHKGIGNRDGLVVVADELHLVDAGGES